MDNKQEFLKELRELLQKYNVSIQADVGFGSDTHGIHEQHLKICDSKDKPFFRVESWDLTYEDLDIK